MRKMMLAAAAAVLATAFTSTASAQVAYWAHNNNGLPGGGFGFLDGAFPFAAEFGSQAGSATMNVSGGLTADTVVSGGGDTVYQWLQSFSGSTVNAQYGEPAGGSFSIQGGTDSGFGPGNNGAIIEFAFDGTMWTNLVFSYAGRRTSTGFSSLTIDAYDGGSYLSTLVAGLDMTTSSTLALYSYDASVLDGIADARIVITVNGATSATGNIRMDNMLIDGTPVPTPGALALFGVAGVAGIRRRR